LTPADAPGYSGSTPSGRVRAISKRASLSGYQVLGPTDFSNQWLEFFVVPIGAVELAHVPEVLSGESLDTRELGAQIRRQPLHDRLSPNASAGLALTDDPADVPVEAEQLL
jgi:hypothetical protein